MPMSKKVGFTAGVYLFETLTSGMYNYPLSVYREYIQNAVHSIDLSNGSKNKQVAITIVPVENTIIIRDNACGIKKEEAFIVLNSIGISNKKGVNSLRGFRGIGRLGGIAFSNRVIFSTKFDGEDSVSRQEWDCVKLREILHDPHLAAMRLEEPSSKGIRFFSGRGGPLPTKLF